MKGYKGFDQNLQCRGFQYEIGETYTMDSEPCICDRGFHFCKKLTDVHRFYNLSTSRVCEIEAAGIIIHSKYGEKSVCNSITLIRELSKEEILALANTGTNNSGSLNVGDRNSGNLNVGCFCSCNNSAGIFMSKRITYEAFNKVLSADEYKQILDSYGFSIVCRFKLVRFTYRRCKGGKKETTCLSYKESWRVFWDSLTPKEKLAVKRIPHFDADVFYDITGIKLSGAKK